ncbi:ATP-binding protein [Kitasatospora sp. NPDC097643]|uniref:ATP-binding protein n=1 Tax=Kitasatospora sp. NPDC097643 TaxID=3157230 RepID=UPI003330E321
MAAGTPATVRTGSLGVLEQAVLDAGYDLTPVLNHLHDLGLRDPSWTVKRSLAVGLAHCSFLYEHPDLFPGVTRGLLDTLYGLGNTYIWRHAGIRGYQQLQSPLTAGALSKHASTVSRQVPDWAMQQPWLLRSCRLSTGLEGKPLPPRVAATVLLQLVGVLCVLDRQDVAERLTESLVADVTRSEAVADPKTRLQVLLGKDAPTYEFNREGPDHEAVFTAIAADSTGRQGIGRGSSKKAASRNAALDFIARHLPHALQAVERLEVRRVPPGEIPGHAAHVAAVRRIQDLFSLPPSARPLLGQALVHASWAYEQRPLLEAMHQHDNQPLGFIGSHVLSFEYVLAQARRAVLSPPDAFLSTSVPNAVYDSALRLAGLESALLLGVGQEGQGIPIELGSNAFQAVIAAVFVAKNFPPSLAEDWPLEWKAVWPGLMPEAAFDTTTALEKIASGMQLQVEYTYREYGPDHDKQRRATAVLTSPLLQTSVSAREGEPISAKKAARQAAAQVVLDILDALASRRPAKALAAAPERDRSVARFILAHQAAALTRSTIPLPRWISGQLFGLHWAASSEALLEWATEADQLMTRAMSFADGISSFQKAFRAARDAERADDQARSIDLELSNLLGRIERLDDPEALTGDDLQRLVQLCDIYRCMGTDDPDTALADIVDDWTLLHRGRLDITGSPDKPDAELTGRERAVLDALASTLLKTARTASVEILGSQPLRLRFNADLDATQQQAVDQACTLWAGVTRTVTITPVHQGIEATIAGTHAPATRGPITRAALTALRPGTEPYLASVADLLHDLKNQVTAARTAASTPANSRTARLEHQLTASRHLDQAQALAIRLKASTSTLSYDGEQAIELGPFLRTYAATVLTRLPGTISLSIPDARRAAHIAIGDRTLRAILDNLVGNAIEAMPHGGAITLEWTADDYEAVVEIADTGPGVPPDILNALTSGERIRSTKPGGNGLGLLGARSLLTRAGGHLAAPPTASGTTWLLTLPVAPAPSRETS